MEIGTHEHFMSNTHHQARHRGGFSTPFVLLVVVVLLVLDENAPPQSDTSGGEGGRRWAGNPERSQIGERRDAAFTEWSGTVLLQRTD